MISYRSEFGGILFYYYICDRTNLFADSTKVCDLLFLKLCIKFDLLRLCCVIFILNCKFCLHRNNYRIISRNKHIWALWGAHQVTTNHGLAYSYEIYVNPVQTEWCVALDSSLCNMNSCTLLSWLNSWNCNFHNIILYV